jgi:hypothetical protein
MSIGTVKFGQSVIVTSWRVDTQQDYVDVGGDWGPATIPGMKTNTMVITLTGKEEELARLGAALMGIE